MTIYTSFIVFPDGEEQEIEHSLQINQFVDINGIPLRMPLPTKRMIVYRVCRKSTRENRGEVNTYYHLEQMNSNELIDYVK